MKIAYQLFFALLLLSSGFCGISYEILYGRILGNSLGDQFLVTSSVLLTFLLGIGFGTFYAHRLWKHLWLLEGLIGIYGAAIALSSDIHDDLFYAVLPLLAGSSVGPLLVCVLVLLVPAFLIGTSLPLFAGYLSRISSGLVFAKAYTIYNIGAALTVLLIEFWLIRKVGIRAATLCIAGINVFVALSLITVFRKLRNEVVETVKKKDIQFPFSQLAALALASVASAIFQLLMVKISEFIFGPFRESFALVLSLILLGIALGSMAVTYLRINFRINMMANLVGMVILLAGFTHAVERFAALYRGAADSHFEMVALKLVTLALVMGLPALTFGAAIPAMITQQSNVAKESGQLLFISSLANAFGFLLLVFFLHEAFDYGILILIIAGLSTCSLVIYRLKFGLHTVAAVLMFFLAVFAHQKLWDENLLYIGHTSFHSSNGLAEEREDFEFPEKFKVRDDVFSIIRSNGRSFFFINGYISMPLNAPWEPLVGAFSSTFAPRSDKALVLGVGSGATASTVGQLFDKTTGVEINAAVLENLHRMKEYNFDIENNPDVTIVHDDGIHFSKTSKEKFSLVVNTVTTPLYFSSAKLYTKDFLEVIKDRMEPDGVYVTWIDSRVGDRGVDIIFNTLDSTFQHCGIGYIRSSYFLLLCSEEPIQAQQPNIVADHPVLGPFFMKKFGFKPDWLPYGLLHTDVTSLIDDTDTPLNTMNYPALEFEMSRLRRRGYTDFKNRLRDGMSFGNISQAFTANMDWNPFHLLKHTEVMLGKSRYTKRWEKLVKGKVRNFEFRHAEAELEYYRDYANVGDSANRFHKLGYRLMKSGRYEEAIKSFEKALELNPQRNNSYFNIGASYERLKQYPEALESYSKELLVDPAEDAASYRLGRVMVKMKDYEKGIEMLDRALDEKKRSGAHYYRGLAYEGLGNSAEAILSYKAALKIDQDYEAASEALDRLEAVTPSS